MRYDTFEGKILIHNNRATHTLYFDDCQRIYTNCDIRAHPEAVRNGNMKYIGFRGAKSFLLLRTPDAKAFEDIAAPLRRLPQHEACVGQVSQTAPTQSPRGRSEQVRAPQRSRTPTERSISPIGRAA